MSDAKPYTRSGYVVDRMHGDVDQDMMLATVEALDRAERERDEARKTIVIIDDLRADAEKREAALKARAEKAEAALRLCIGALEIATPYLPSEGLQPALDAARKVLP